MRTTRIFHVILISGLICGGYMAMGRVDGERTGVITEWTGYSLEF